MYTFVRMQSYKREGIPAVFPSPDINQAEQAGRLSLFCIANTYSRKTYFETKNMHLLSCLVQFRRMELTQ